MRKLLYTLLMIFLLISCQKENLDEYVVIEDDITQDPFGNDYANGGSLPDIDESENKLIGTIWVITSVQTSFSGKYPNDTLRFINNNQYTINNGASKTYQLSSEVNTNMKHLSLHYCFTIGSGIYSAKLSKTFIEDGIINDALFKNDYDGQDKDRLVTMEKI